MLESLYSELGHIWMTKMAQFIPHTLLKYPSGGGLLKSYAGIYRFFLTSIMTIQEHFIQS